MRRCIEFGAAGFIPKSTEIEEMRKAIRIILAGEIWTPADLDLADAGRRRDGRHDALARVSRL